jgi:hypothetical protein
MEERQRLVARLLCGEAVTEILPRISAYPAKLATRSSTADVHRLTVIGGRSRA